MDEIAQLLSQAAEHLRRRNLPAADALLRQILRDHPQHPQGLNLAAGVAHAQGNFARSSELLQQAVAADPTRVDLYLNLGEALARLGRLPEAEQAYRSGLERAPDLPELHCNLGNVLLQAGHLDVALQHLERAVTIAPGFAEGHYNLARAYHLLHRYADAIAAYKRATAARPNFAQAHYNCGVVYQKLDDATHAAEQYERALAIRPGYLQALNNLGTLRSPHERAAEVLELALKLKPDYAAAAANLGAHYGRVGQARKAIALARRAVELDPNSHAIHSALIFRMLHDPETSQDDIGAELTKWNARFAAHLSDELPSLANDPDPHRRLRIGFLSAELFDQVIMWNNLPLIETLDRSRFEVYCYGNSHRSDATTARLAAISTFISVASMSDLQLTERIREDGIDLLVEFNVHTAGNRLLALARRAAPVQFTYAGYPGSTGLKTVDYRISDRHMDPPGMFEHACSERIARLPHTFWCFRPQPTDPETNDLPALTQNMVTFACLNQMKKISEAVIALHARVVREVPNSRLMLLSPEGSHRQYILDQFLSHLIPADRILFVPTTTRPNYMRYYHRADISLDQFPYCGHTTSIDSLWMGVPVVTLPRNTIASRAGLGLLTELNLPELIARDEADYIRIARELAADIPRLAELRRTLRNRMRASPLMDVPAFTRAFEQILLSAWHEWCRTSGAAVHPTPSSGRQPS